MTLIQILEVYKTMLKEGQGRMKANKWLKDSGLSKSVCQCINDTVTDAGRYIRIKV